MKNQGNMTPPKEQNNCSVTNPKEIEICNFPNKEFKIAVLRKFSELKEKNKKKAI